MSKLCQRICFFSGSTLTLLPLIQYIYNIKTYCLEDFLLDGWAAELNFRGCFTVFQYKPQELNRCRNDWSKAESSLPAGQCKSQITGQKQVRSKECVVVYERVLTCSVRWMHSWRSGISRCCCFIINLYSSRRGSNVLLMSPTAQEQFKIHDVSSKSCSQHVRPGLHSVLYFCWML